jgi:hypothetical protein
LKVIGENTMTPESDPDPNPDPLVRGTDPRIRNCIKCHGSATLLFSIHIKVLWTQVQTQVFVNNTINFKLFIKKIALFFLISLQKTSMRQKKPQNSLEKIQLFKTRNFLIFSSGSAAFLLKGLSHNMNIFLLKD